VLICLERGADLHMAQLMLLPLTDSRVSKIQIGFSFLVPAHPGSPRQRAIKWVCVCVNECFIHQHRYYTVKTVKSRAVSTGQKGSKSTYNCPVKTISALLTCRRKTCKVFPKVIMCKYLKAVLCMDLGFSKCSDDCKHFKLTYKNVE